MHYQNYEGDNYNYARTNNTHQAQLGELAKLQQHTNNIIRKASYDEDESHLEIIKQGYGITELMKNDILATYKESSIQKEYKNPADFIKHKLDAKFGHFWFVFMWEHKSHQSAQYSYYNQDDRVLEFILNGWHILIYSFNQVVPKREDQKTPIPQTQPQQFPQNNQQNHLYDINSKKNRFHPPMPDFNQEFDSHFIDPKYPYPSLQQRRSQFRPRWYYQ